MKVAVIGLGYVGLSISVLLSTRFRVSAFDIDENKVAMINARQSPIEDADIEQHFNNGLLKLSASTSFDQAVRNSNFVVVATPTDYDPKQNKFDTESVRTSVQKTLELNPSAHIFIKSTIPIGFVEQIRKEFDARNIYFSPEFLREGSALHDNLNPSRIIVGGREEACHEFAQMLAACSERENCPIIFMGTREAEAVKLFANTYLAMRVSYFNELDSFCLSWGLETSDVIEGVCLEPRIGQGYNNPSFGYGGYCFPKDTKQMLANFGDIPQSLISAVVASNEDRAEYLVSQIMKSSPQIVGVYRLSMKSGSDNYRQSAVFGITQRLTELGVQVMFYEPNCNDDELLGMQKVESLEILKAKAEIIIANRLSQELGDVRTKVFTRDVFNVD